MASIGFCGLGRMGRLMAGRLLGAGHEVTVWNRSEGPQAALAEQGARIAATPEEAAAGAELVVTMVTGPDALEAVVYGPHGVAAGLRTGALLVDMSTVGPDAFQMVADRLGPGRGAVDAPVRGSVREAADGTLQVYVGAGDDDFGRVAPLLSALGDVRHVGPPGAGASMKLVVNATLVTAIALLGEAMALGRHLGLDRATLLDVLSRSPLAPTVAAKGDNVAAGRYPPAFELSLADKDIHLVLDAARRHGLDLKVAEAARQWTDAALSATESEVDFSAVVATVMGEKAQP